MSVRRYTTPNGRKRWRARVWDPTLGDKGGWVHLGNRDTRREGQDLIDAHRERSRIPSAQNTTVAAWRDLWLRTSVVADSTRVWHRERTANFAKKHGTKLLADIPRTVAMEWAADAPSEAKALSAMWGAAIRARIVREHIWEGLITRTVSSIEPGWLTAADIDTLAAAAIAAHGPGYGEHVATLIRFAAYVGLRAGELAGLRWIDLDPDAGLLYVRRQANSTLNEITSPKRDRQRTVVYPQIAQRAIAAHFRVSDEYVFTTRTGAILYAPNRNTIWSPVRNYARRPKMRFHELRHFAATWLLEQGVSDSDVAVQLGHTDGGRLVRSTYGHPRADPALARVRAALDGPAPDIDRTSTGRIAREGA